MSTPINLNKARKARARVAAKDKADQNAVAFGRSKAEKERGKAQVARSEQRLDGHKRER